jgi:hypothetical protein
MEIPWQDVGCGNTNKSHQNALSWLISSCSMPIARVHILRCFEIKS